MAEQCILECRNVSKHYGALVAVDDIDLRIQSGETVGIGGPNGAGKTTFFDLISGLTAVSGGQVLFNGDPIIGVPPHQLFHMGLARTFQVTDGFGSLSVEQNILASLVYGGGKERPGILLGKRHRMRAAEIMEEYHLSHLAQAMVSDIPALDRKKLMVATAVMHDPKVLLLDEPVGGLTPPEIDAFIELMADVRKKGISIVFIEHVMRFLTTVADRALIMHQGRLIYDGTPQGIASDETVKSVYLGSSADQMVGGAA
ncbi:ABC transporter ATP-binding protein [Ruegeria halocynthiae]|uniref:ABC transporter ATP-binding protein n=1 Tax=Ruegeria halocynthiae TaxID=985054 RepID=UPI00056C27A3|nr:ATP-binding cassette domain-containing protein [Ruegeria halocynthiae]